MPTEPTPAAVKHIWNPKATVPGSVATCCGLTVPGFSVECLNPEVFRDGIDGRTEGVCPECLEGMGRIFGYPR